MPEKRKWKWRVAAIAALLFLFSIVQTPVIPDLVTGSPGLRFGPFLFGRPMVLTGDSPHYLVIVNSLVSDGDLDLRNNYDRSEAGFWDAGARFRGQPIARHVEEDSKGRQWSIHPPFLPMILAFFSWPFRGTVWVESVSIWVSLAGAAIALFFLARKRGGNATSAFLVAFATPLACYARDLWTEPWIAVIWTSLLLTRNLAAVALLALVGILIRYPFMLVTGIMGLMAWWEKDWKRASVLLLSSLAGFTVIQATVQYVFRDVDHFGLFHMGGHSRFRPSLFYVAGLFLSPRDGLLPFFPVLGFGLWQLMKSGLNGIPAAAYVLLHAGGGGWHGGTAFSARYLVPITPMLILQLAGKSPRHWLFKAALVYSLFWGVTAALFPALVYERSPWEVVMHVISRLPFYL